MLSPVVIRVHLVGGRSKVIFQLSAQAEEGCRFLLCNGINSCAIIALDNAILITSVDNRNLDHHLCAAGADLFRGCEVSSTAVVDSEVYGRVTLCADETKWAPVTVGSTTLRAEVYS